MYKITDWEQEAKNISQWLKEYADRSGIKTLVIGVSGGIDSAVVAKICENTGLRTIGIFMPLDISEENKNSDLVDAVFEDSKMEYYQMTIDPMVEAYKCHKAWKFVDNNNPTRGGANNVKLFTSKLGEGNLRARIRANILYEIARNNQGLVVGTDNYDEAMLGYCTKGGDGLVDVLPISAYHKWQVYELAKTKILDVSQVNIDVVPSANLWEGQTDEGEWGMTYDEVATALDTYNGVYLPEQPLSKRFEEVYSKVLKMIKNSAHKRALPPSYTPNI